MRLADITVEVRDPALVRVGQIRPEDLDLQIADDFNNVGTWSITIPVGHSLAGQLRTPGSGIIVTGPSDVLISGPVTGVRTEATATDPEGTLTVSGVSDSVLLADSLAYADPLNYAAGADLGSAAIEDKRTGTAETLMHQFVTVNIGPGAPAARRTGLLAKITMGANGGRGAVTTKTAAYTVLGTLLAELASVANLGFRIVQRGAGLVFETYAVLDRTATIRLDITNSTLAGSKVIVSPPAATRVLVAGKSTSDSGLVTSRAFVVSTSTESLDAEAEWSRRIEVYKDNSSIADAAELAQTGREELADKGMTTLAVQAVPMDDSAMPYGTAWSMGDKITVVVEDQELSATVSGFLLHANADGFRVGALIGDPTGFDRFAKTIKRVTAVESRLSALERLTAATATAASAQVTALSGTVESVSDNADDTAADVAALSASVSALTSTMAAHTTTLGRLPARMAAGSVSITPVANTPTSISITFPSGRFTATPFIQVSAATIVPGSTVTEVSFASASSTGCDIWVYRTNTTATTVHWLAVQF